MILKSLLVKHVSNKCCWLINKLAKRLMGFLAVSFKKYLNSFRNFICSTFIIFICFCSSRINYQASSPFSEVLDTRNMSLFVVVNQIRGNDLFLLL